MIILAIIGILMGLILPNMNKKSNDKSIIKSDGTECIRGYVFVKSNNELKQLISVNGGGVLCQN
jgi:competence protein ComGC